MKLYYTTTSPFARKVRIAAAILGFEKELQLVQADVFNDPNYKSINPLVKVPTLETREGLSLTNSPFILDYLDSLSTQKKIIPSDKSKWQALQFQSIADGIMEASVLRRLESLRPVEKQDIKADQRQKDKIENGLAYFEKNIDLLKPMWSIAEISFFCALGYLELRFPEEKWQARFPSIQRWFEEASSTSWAKETVHKLS